MWLIRGILNLVNVRSTKKIWVLVIEDVDSEAV